MNRLFNVAKNTIGAHLFNRYVPDNIMLSVTNRCNSRCAYCDIPGHAGKELSTADVRRLLDEAAALGTSRLALWGGEPLVRDDIGEIIRYAKAKGLYVNLDTNGYLVPSKIGELKHLDLLVVSLDGPEDVHDANREPGGFRKAADAIRAAKDAGIRVWTITTLTKHSGPGTIDFVLDMASRKGFMASFQIMHHNAYLAGDKAALYATDEEYRRMLETLIGRKKKGDPIVTSMAFLRYLAGLKGYKESVGRSGTTRAPYCWAGKLYCNIEADGTVYPCVMKMGEPGYRNFLDAGLKEAFRHLAGGSCGHCTASGVMEYNYLYSLKPSVILNWMRILP